MRRVVRERVVLRLNKPREEDQRINIVLRIGMKTDTNKGKQIEEDKWIHKSPKKEASFDLNRAKETFMEAKKNFAEAPLRVARIKPSQRGILLC